MRLFIGIDLDPELRTHIERFIEGVQGFAPDARWMRPESLHVTLKFIGERPEEHVELLTQHLQSVPSGPFELRFTGYGFFPTAKAPRVFWIGIQADAHLVELAANIDAATSELGIPREERPYSPHLTLARAGGRSGAPKSRKHDAPKSAFAVLEKRLAAMGELDFGRMTAREFILYQSELSPRGSKYTKLQRFLLR
jgi:2'-5' RNA ligase